MILYAREIVGGNVDEQFTMVKNDLSKMLEEIKFLENKEPQLTAASSVFQAYKKRVVIYNYILKNIIQNIEVATSAVAVGQTTVRKTILINYKMPNSKVVESLEPADFYDEFVANFDAIVKEATK